MATSHVIECNNYRFLSLFKTDPFVRIGLDNISEIYFHEHSDIRKIMECEEVQTKRIQITKKPLEAKNRLKCLKMNMGRKSISWNRKRY